MKTISLHWCAFPAIIFKHLADYRWERNFCWPTIGPGVYLFVFPTSKGFQVYYIGEASEIGDRLNVHYNEYSTARADYYLATSMEKYEEDIFKLFSDSTSPFLSKETEDFPESKRKDIGAKLMRKTTFMYAQLRTSDKQVLRDIEATLHHALLMKNNLNKCKWFGEKTSRIPDYEMTVESIYPKEKLEKMISPSIPSIIKVSNGQISF